MNIYVRVRVSLFHFGPLVPFCVCHMFIPVPCAHVIAVMVMDCLVHLLLVEFAIVCVFKLCFIMLVVLYCLYFVWGAVVFFCYDAPCSGLSS